MESRFGATMNLPKIKTVVFKSLSLYRKDPNKNHGLETADCSGSGQGGLCERPLQHVLRLK